MPKFSVFHFSSPTASYNFVVETAIPIGVSNGNFVITGGVFPLELGGTGGSNAYLESNEFCVQGTCANGLTYEQGRFVSAGEINAPEPTSVGLLSLGAILPVLRRKRA